MIGVLNDDNDLAYATAAAAWQPASPPKAGIMVYAANNLKSYTDAVFSALVTVQGVRTNPSPRRFALMQNYPNPFNPTTVISYKLSAFSSVTLKVYDILGREVATLVNGRESAGSHSVTFDGSRLASGVYFYRLEAGASSDTKKLILVR
ncbi:MAG: hypothetical protein B7Z63_03285 [Ignavibacteriae bacterium 37-53-5]|nr:MAG: hypothetical protein B7Z63_03285 [Ignavibacteriae bacterium 37-53-5]